MDRGSRRHILDWTAQENFPNDLVALVQPVQVRFTDKSRWMPRGYDAPEEARLETFGPRVLPGHPAWSELSKWWLKHTAGANTPNWDLAVHCAVEGRPGLVLVEAKANEPELARAGKRPARKESARSVDNHDQIGKAIGDARDALGTRFPGLSIDRDKHYQLSNRIAFAWKLASLRVPTVLVYLGFLGDEEMDRHFEDHAHWDECFKGHLRGVCPEEILEATIDLETAPMWVLSRTRSVIHPSPKSDNQLDRPEERPMSIRSDATKWLARTHGVKQGTIATSKYYRPEESWTGADAWWVQVPLAAVEQGTDVHIVCQRQPDSSQFRYLRVPASFLRDHLDDVAVINSSHINLFLDAVEEPFTDRRGPGRLAFAQFERAQRDEVPHDRQQRPVW